ncbi:MAG: HEAT repeat domain-containing protein [Planctomycetota bacterium]
MPIHVCRLPLVIAPLLLGLLLVACGEREQKGLYQVDDSDTSLDEERILELIEQLAQARDSQDAAASKAFDEAVHELTLMGSTIEPYLIEALIGEEDWSVRYGTIHVLDSVGSKNAVKPLIRSLDDEHPLVAQKAMYSLRVFTDHRIVPEQAGSSEDPLRDRVPPIPDRAPDDLRRDADYQIWVEWHRQHGDALRTAWEDWWEENSTLVRVE